MRKSIAAFVSAAVVLCGVSAAHAEPETGFVTTYLPERVVHSS